VTLLQSDSYRGTVETRVRKWFLENCMFKLLPKWSEWRCSSDGRWQGVPCPCSWHRESSVTQHWTMRHRYNQHHGIGAAMSLSIQITDQL